MRLKIGFQAAAKQCASLHSIALPKLPNIQAIYLIGKKKPKISPSASLLCKPVCVKSTPLPGQIKNQP